MDTSLLYCVNLLKENEDYVRESAQCMLLTLCQNILKHPQERKYRQVQLDDPTVVDRLLPAAGAMECLFDVGFVEAADHLFLPKDASLSKLKNLWELLSMTVPSTSKITEPVNKRNESAPLSEKNFFVKIRQQFHSVMRYEDALLQKKARRIIPIVRLEIGTMKRIRELQKSTKSTQLHAGEKTAEGSVPVKMLFLAELLHWFKNEFFEWVDSPKCPKCLGECAYESVKRSKEPKCSRTEFHRCKKCNTLVKFPRYYDPEPLLTLRRGRCGEWGNVFTLLCRSLGYDARLICDETDHLWTEIWSDIDNAWIHVDPCENVMDRPLLYEKGWGKKLSYIIAYSKDEVQDVTWRYTEKQDDVMQRRKMCSEESLLELLETLNTQRQFSDDYSLVRRKYVTKRRALELAGMLKVPGAQVIDCDNYQERTSGSYAWKLQRGEVSQKNFEKKHVWEISKYSRKFQLHYHMVDDVYRVLGTEDFVVEEKSGWQNGVEMSEGGMFRKVETDWKMVYLARSPDTTHGRIKWSFEVAKPDMCISTFSFQAVVAVFHEATVSWEIEAFFEPTERQARKSQRFSINDYTGFYTDQLRGARKLTLTATVTGGKGEAAWQHAQLFRQSLDDKEARSMVICIGLCDRDF